MKNSKFMEVFYMGKWERYSIENRLYPDELKGIMEEKEVTLAIADGVTVKDTRK